MQQASIQAELVKVQTTTDNTIRLTFDCEEDKEAAKLFLDMIRHYGSLAFVSEGESN